VFSCAFAIEIIDKKMNGSSRLLKLNWGFPDPAILTDCLVVAFMFITF
jgi:hypothetical protein